MFFCLLYAVTVRSHIMHNYLLGILQVLCIYACVRVGVYVYVNARVYVCSSGRISPLLSDYRLCLGISLCRPFTVSLTPHLTSTTGPSV